MKPIAIGQIILTCVMMAGISSFTSSAEPLPEGSLNKWEADSSARGSSGFEMRRFDQGTDYSGPVVSTVIRKRVAGGKSPRGAVLYIHGFNDYFFQGEMADSFIAHGYDFYAVDLRKYGRSLMPGQKLAQTRSLTEYFPDIDSAMTVMESDDHKRFILAAHSTGGLIACFFMKKMEQKADTAVISRVEAMILNSPFLDWNLRSLECLIPAVAFSGKLFPNIPVRQGGAAYSESLLKRCHGEWSYNEEWKRFNSTDVDLGWVRAIERAQRFVRKDRFPINVPILLMHSARSIGGGEWTPGHNCADGVLDVDDIRSYGRRLGPDVTSVSVEGGLHDLVLSSPEVRKEVYKYMFRWLSYSCTDQSVLNNLKADGVTNF